MSTDGDGVILPFRREEDRPDPAVLPGQQPGPGPDGGQVVGPILDGELLDPEPDTPTRAAEVRPHFPAAEPWRPPVAGESRPVLPAWLADPGTRRAAGRWAIGRVKHRVAYHGVRLPVYVLRMLARAAIGAARLVGWVTRWVSDAEARPVRLAAAASGETAAYLAARRMRDQAVKTRLRVCAALAVLGLAGGMVLWLATPPLVSRGVIAAVVLALAWAGRNPDRPVVASAVVPTGGFTRLTEPIVVRAFTAAGLGGKAGKVAKDGQVEETATGTVTMAAPVARDGAGWLAVVDLPFGKTFTDAAAKQEEIASGLGHLSAVQVFLTSVESSVRRVEMWVADQDPYTGRPNTSPMAKCPPVTVWEPQRLGVDARAREIRLPLIFNGYVVGSVPRQGKTFTVRNLIAPAILDPYCDVTVLGAKSSDWEDAEQVAVHYRAGEGDDETTEYSVAALRQLLTECQDRYDAIRALPRERRPEGKITPELQAEGFRPHVIVVEECQNILGHKDAGGGKKSDLAKEAMHLCTVLAKVGPAAGYILVLATQRPSTEVIPADLRDVLSVRIALKVNDRVSSDTILGDYRSARGIESASLINGRHAGVATIVGVDNGRGSDWARIRTDLLTAEQFGRVCQVGRQRRIDAGTLRGHAAGEADAVAVDVSVVADVLAVWPGNEAKVWADVLCERLVELRPKLYAGLDPAGLTRALAPHKVRSVQINRRGTNKQGYELAAVRGAADRAAGAGEDVDP